MSVNDSTIAGIFNSLEETETTTFIDFDALIAKAAHPQSVAKDKAEVIAVQLSGAKTKEAVLAHNAMTAIWADIDTGDYNLSAIKDTLTGLGCYSLIYSTASSKRYYPQTKTKPAGVHGKRWRIIIPLRQAVSCKRWYELQDYLIHLFDGDACSARVNQILFAPNIPELVSSPAPLSKKQERHYEYCGIDGNVLDPEKLPAPITDWLKVYRAAATAEAELATEQAIQRNVNSVMDKALNRSALSGGFSIAQANKFLPVTQKLMVSYDYKKKGKKYQTPNSSGKNPAGVLVFPDGRWFSHHSSDDSAGIGHACANGRCGDAFDLYSFYEHGNDTGAALKTLANEYDQDGQKERQREHMEQQDDNEITVTVSSNPLAQLRALSLVNSISEMEKNLSKDTFIFDGLALDGQITLFYAKPNTGKTLLFMRFLIDAIEAELVEGQDVFYINADDHYKGLLTKTRIARDCGFQMISPQTSGISPSDVISILEAMALDGSARGKVIVLDTHKKFVNMMSKEKQSALFLTLRKLTSKNATVIIAGHANKYPDPDGNLIFEGTMDVMNDTDAVYSVNQLSNDGEKFAVRFQNEKSRGSNIPSVSYEYTKKEAMGYRNILDSVCRLDKKGSSDAEANARDEIAREKYESEIFFITSLLDQKEHNVAEIKAEFASGDHDITGEFSRRDLTAALDRFNGKKWTSRRGEKNEKIFSKMATKAEYSQAKNG